MTPMTHSIVPNLTRSVRRSRSLARASVLTACWSLLYVASKVDYALDGRLGVHGGPQVPPEAYAEHTNVSADQWGNAAVGVGLVALVLLPLVPPAQRWPRWTLVVPIAVVAAATLASGVGFYVRELTGDGGGLFATYTVVWAVLLGRLAATVWSRPEPSFPSR